jgi:hypothetical protein
MSLWTEEERQILFEALTNGLKPSEVSISGRSPAAVAAKMSRLNVNKIKSWTIEERKLLKKHYRNLSYEELSLLIPNRTAGSISGQVAFLNKRGWAI